LECLGRLSWMSVGKLGDLGDRPSDKCTLLLLMD